MISFFLGTLVVLFSFNNNVEGFAHDREYERMLNGESAKILDFPFFTGLRNCGAAILSDRWVVTAAHCVDNKLYSAGYVWVGGESFTNSKLVAYNSVVLHPNWSSSRHIPVDDIALLHLYEPLEFTEKIQPVKLPDEKAFQKDLVLVARGTDETGRQSQNIKQMNVKRLTTEECLNRIPRHVSAMIKPFVSSLEKAIICGIRPDGKPGVCPGDSGSPLVQDNTLVGVVSFIGNIDGSQTVKCENTRLGFYVNVANYVPWIKSVTGMN